MTPAAARPRPAPAAPAPGAPFNGIDYVDVAAEPDHAVRPLPERGARPRAACTASRRDDHRRRRRHAHDQPDRRGDRLERRQRGRPVLALTVAAPGDFSTYPLTIFSDQLDPFFDSVPFTFKANLPDDARLRDAAARPAPRPRPSRCLIDYLAKDFASFRQALSEFSALRYPAWVERSEADLGVVLMEALAAMADELSYYQDRVSAESTIQTATQRLSVVRHARLVDYEPAPATVATTVLQLDVADPPATSPPLEPGHELDDRHAAAVPGARSRRVDHRLRDRGPGRGPGGPIGTAPPGRSSTRAGTGPACRLTTGTTASAACPPARPSFYVARSRPSGSTPGQQLLLDTPAPRQRRPPGPGTGHGLGGNETPTADRATGCRRLLADQVSLQAAHGRGPRPVQHHGGREHRPGRPGRAPERDLRRSRTRRVPPPGPVVVRAGANWTPKIRGPDYRYCLSSGPLAWLATATPGRGHLGARAARDRAQRERARRRHVTMGVPALAARRRVPTDQVFTLTPEQYSPVLTSNGTTWFDYDGDGGTTIRFGDGTFGASPPPGTVFTVAVPGGRRLGRQRPRRTRS